MDVIGEDFSDELHRIPGDAHVLRRVHKNDVDFTQPIPVLPRAFRPSSLDTDGLSVYLDEQHGGPAPEQIAAAGRGGSESYVIVQFLVSDLRRIGLDVVPNEIPDELPKHALIPELNVVDYQADKQSKRHQKVLQMKLSELATDAIVYPSNLDTLNH